MKTNLLVQISWVLAVAMAVAAAGCGQNGGAGQKFDTSASGPHRAGVSTSEQGTVDGGGGAGFKGRPLESYRRDITDLKAFPEYQLVDAVLKSIERVNVDHAKIFRHIVKDRLWLFMNAPIPKLSSARQGAPFTLDQWAVQNSKEIWLSNQYRGSAQARAKILLHEILVGLKIMRFLSYNEYCFQFAQNRASCGNDLVTNAPLIKEPELTDLDHADVRQMGEWLWQHHATMTAQEFGYEMHARQFQSPHHQWKPMASQYLETRKLNPIVDHLNERSYDLYTDWDVNAIAQGKCTLRFNPDSSNRLMHVNVEVRSLKTNQLTRLIAYDVSYDPAVATETWVRADVHGRSVNWSAQGGSLKKVGDRGSNVSVEIASGAVVEFNGGESQVIKVDNGATSTSGDDQGPLGLSCDESPVRLPTAYEVWLEMRPRDREMIERQYFKGRTLTEILTELSRSPLYHLRR